MAPVYALSTITIPAPSLPTSLHMPALFALLNRVFSHAHVYGAGYEILPASVGRLEKPEQLASELGPEGFCMVAFSKANDGDMGEIVATASAKPYYADKAREGAGGEVNLAFKRPAAAGAVQTEVNGEGDGTPAWELLAMAVEPGLQGKGISTQLLDLTIDDIKRRVSEKSASEEGGIRILISTMKEMTEAYYAKKGWTTTEERKFPAGTAGSRTGFTVVEMVKNI